MYTVHFSKKFKKDFKKISRNSDFKINKLNYILHTLKLGKILEPKYRNHKLQGKLKKCFECHVQPDILLIYEVDEEKLMISLAGLGSHSDLF